MLGARAGRRGAGRPGAGDAARPPDLGRRRRALPGPARGARARRGRAPTRRRSTPSRRRPARWSQAMEDAGWDAGRRRRRGRRRLGRSGRSRGVLRLRRRPRSCPGWPRTTDELDRACCTRSTAASSRPGPSGSPLRGLVNVLPTGRNFYSVDPKAVPSRLAWETGQAMADSLLDALPRRHRRATRASVGLSVWGTSRDAHLRRRHRRGARAARRPPGLGRGVPPGHRPRGRSRSPSSAGRASTSPCGSRGFFRDAFPHVVDHARRRRAAGRRRSTSRTSRTTSARTPGPTWPSTATSGGPPPGSSAPSRAPTAPGCCR